MILEMWDYLFCLGLPPTILDRGSMASGIIALLMHPSRASLLNTVKRMTGDPFRCLISVICSMKLLARRHDGA